MNPCMTTLRQVIQPFSNFPNMVDLPLFRRKDKVIFVMGATGTGKSRLAIDLATRFPAEIINSDKIQVYKGLDIVTNKVTQEESLGIPHHLLGTIDNIYQDFTVEEFKIEALRAIESIVSRDHVPIIAGGSNSYIEALVNDCVDFQLRYSSCFLWVDVDKPVLNSFVSERVDKMIEMGLVDEVRRIFDLSNSDYSYGIRRAIGVPELDEFLREEWRNKPVEIKERLLDRHVHSGIRFRPLDEFVQEEWQNKPAEIKERLLERYRYSGIRSEVKYPGQLLEEAIERIKENNCLLASRQLKKIQRLYKEWKWNMKRIDATEVFMGRGEEADEAWEKAVVSPSVLVVERFLDYSDDHRLDSVKMILPEISIVPILPAVVTGIFH